MALRIRVPILEPEGAAPPPVANLVKVWTGSAWAEKPVKVWTGAEWAEKPVKRWTGSAWVDA